jgi:hypothetical protein
MDSPIARYTDHHSCLVGFLIMERAEESDGALAVELFVAVTFPSSELDKAHTLRTPSTTAGRSWPMITAS